jgi:glycosyltransferase involved in cell wall biosynthesis
MSVPYVSAILTCYNSQGTIRRAVESVVTQTFGDLEIIVVDDASTDATVAAVEAIADERIRVIRNATNRGIGGAKNVGVANSHGTYIAFLDSDDEWLPSKLAVQLDALSKAPADCPLSFTAFWVHRAETEKVVLRSPRRHGTWLRSILLGETFSLGSTLLATRKCFDDVGPFNERLTRLQDRDWTLRYLQRRSEFLFVNEPLARIYNSGWPRPEVVARAVELLYRAHEEDLKTRDPSLADLFWASLCFETAVHEYRSGQHVAAARRFAKALATHPPYVGYLAGRLQRKLIESDAT